MAMQWPIDCVERVKRAMVQRGKERGGILNFLSSPAREKMFGSEVCRAKNFLCRTDPLIWFLRGYYLLDPDLSKIG